MERCKHGMIPETCAICKGLVHSTRELEEDNNMSRWEEEFYEEVDGLDFKRALEATDNVCFETSALSKATNENMENLAGIECPFCNTVFSESLSNIAEYYRCGFCHRTFVTVDSFIHKPESDGDEIDKLFDNLDKINNEELDEEM